MSDPYTRITNRTVVGPTIRPELGPCLDSTYKGNGLEVIQVKVRNKSVVASRIVLERKLGRALKSGMYALHHCDRPRCMNKDHLYEGSPCQNAADRDRRTGNPMWKYRGESHPRHRLTVDLVRRIRELSELGFSLASMTRSLKLPKSTIFGVLSGRTWKHVDTSVLD
jgi:hypothetical protein